MLIVPAENCKE